jgi:hypothetical protein
MKGENPSRKALNEAVTARGYFFITLWALGMILLYGLGGYLGANKLRGYKAETERTRLTWLASETTDGRASVPKIEITPGREPVDVSTGIQINRIEEFSLDKATWVADFDIWFRWSGDRVSPGEHFQVLNGDIEFREREESLAEGNDHYERFNVRARMSFNLDSGRFPFSDQVLTIQIEDAANGAGILRYVPDERDSGVSPLGVPGSLKVIRPITTVKIQLYESRRGDPRLPEGAADVHSRFVFAALIAAPGAPLLTKLFQALFASVAIAVLVFFIKPTQVDPRFGLGVGAFFAGVSNNIYVRSFFPYSDRICLPDMINAIGLATIFLTLVQSTISLYILDTLGREKMRRLFDHVSFAVFLIGYATANAALILAARS